MHETYFRDRGIDQLCMKRISEIGVLIGCVETCFRDRSIDWQCLKHVSEIGVLIEVPFVVLSFVPLLSLLFLDGMVDFRYKWDFQRCFLHPHLSSFLTCQHNVFSLFLLRSSWFGQFQTSLESFPQPSHSGKGV